MKRFKNILFVKSDTNNEAALAHAVVLAKHNQADLTMTDVSEEIPDVSGQGIPEEVVREITNSILESYRKELEKLAETYQDKIEIDIQFKQGKFFLTIIREVLRNNHDLVIKAAENDNGIMSQFFSTTDMHLLRKCPCPVWLVKPGEPETIKRIVAAVDFDESSDDGKNQALNSQIMEMSISLAHREKAELHVVHAWRPIADQVPSTVLTVRPELEVEEYIEDFRQCRVRRLSQLMEEAISWVGQDVYDAVNPKLHAIRGWTPQVISEQIKELNADLLVMGTIGRTGIPGYYIGNTAESILNCIDCSLLAIKPREFVSPVTLE